jgi:hypothetical protein
MSTASNTAPDSVDAAGNKVSYDAYNVMDDDPSTAWRVEGDGKGESLLIEFPLDIIRVNALHIIPGYAKIDPLDGTDRFNENRRIQRVRLEFSDGSSIEADLEDSPELQTIPIPEQDTTFIKLVIMETSEHGGRDYTAISSIGVAGKNCLAYCEDMPPDMVPDEETIAAILSDAETTAGYYDLRIDSGYARCMRIPADMRFDPIYSFYQLEGDTWTVLAAGGDPSLPLYIQDMGVPERLWIGQDR